MAPRSERHQQPRLHRQFDRLQQPVFVNSGHGCPQSDGHLLPEHRRDRQEIPRLLAEPGQAGVEHLPQRHGQPHPGEVAQHPASIALGKDLNIFERAQQLNGEEGVALRPPQQPGDQAVAVDCGERVVTDQGAQGSLAQRA